MVELLSEEELRHQTRGRFPTHFQHAYRLYDLAHGALNGFNREVETAYERATLLICGKAFKSYYAILYLCEVAHTEDAGVILRSLFNLLVIQRWLRIDDSEAKSKKYLGWFWVVMYESIEHDRAIVSPDLAAMVKEQYNNHKALFEFQERGQAGMSKKWYQPEVNTIEQMAEQVGLKDHYEGIYRPLSSLEHSDALGYFSIVAQAQPKVDGSKLALFSDQFVPTYIRNAFMYFMDTLRTWNKVHAAFEEAKLDEIIEPAFGFFNSETGQ